MRRLIQFLSASALLLNSVAFAQDSSSSRQTNVPILPDSSYSSDEPRSIFWVPFGSVFAPGLGQYMDHHPYDGAFYTTQAVLGTVLQIDGLTKKDAYLKDDNVYSPSYAHDLDNEILLGGTVALQAGFISAYDTFLDRLPEHQAKGKFQFLKAPAKPADVERAAIDFDYLGRWTTFVPLLVAAAYAPSTMNRDPKPGRTVVRADDLAVGTTASFLAGTGEEAFFRGYFLPYMYEKTDRFWLANLTQTAVFAAGHTYEDLTFPILAGFYFGWLTKRNDFDIREGAFLHFWWDFFAINSELIRDRSLANGAQFRIPPIRFTF